MEADTPDQTTHVMGDRKTADERKAILSRAIANQAASGWRVQSQSDYQAVFAKGKDTSHGIHLFLTIITLGSWSIIWLVVWLMNRERRELASVDEYGNVATQRL